MTPSTMRTGHALRSAIAHGDQLQRSCIAPTTSRVPSFRFPAENPRKSSDPHAGLPARAAPACARSRSAAAGRKRCGRSRAPAPATRRPNRRRNAAGCGSHGANAACLCAARASPPASRPRHSCVGQRCRGEAPASTRAMPAPDPGRTTCRRRVRE